MRIGLMGGSFDPIHVGHLVLAEQLRVSLKLNKVLFIPSGHPPHKDHRLLTPYEHRYNMVALSIADNPYFELSDLEKDESRVHYTVDTLKRLIAMDETPQSYYFLTGADAFLEVGDWHAYQTLFTLCTFVGATRPGVMKTELLKAANALKAQFGERVQVVEISDVSVSSSDIRSRLMSGHSVKYMLPDSVLAYIEEQRLYPGIKR